MNLLEELHIRSLKVRMILQSFDALFQFDLFDIQVWSLPMATLLLDSLPSLTKVIQFKNTIWHQTLEPEISLDLLLIL